MHVCVDGGFELESQKPAPVWGTDMFGALRFEALQHGREPAAKLQLLLERWGSSEGNLSEKAAALSSNKQKQVSH